MQVTDEFDQDTAPEDSSDEENEGRELPYNFSDGSLNPSPEGQGSPNFSVRSRRGVVLLDKVLPVEEGSSYPETGRSSPSGTPNPPTSSTPTPHTSKALKLLGLHERYEATELFNNAAMNPLDLECAHHPCPPLWYPREWRRRP